MSNLLYLGIAVLLSVLGCMVLYLRNRKPTSLNAGIEEFQRELKALAPDYRSDARGHSETRGRGQDPAGPK